MIRPKQVTPEVKKAVHEYKEAKKKAEVMRSKIDKVNAHVLEQNKIFTDKGEQIKESKRMYLCKDDKACNKIYALFNLAAREAGLKPDDMDNEFCPALVAEHDQVKAEWKLIEAGGRMMKMDKPEELNNNLFYGTEKLNGSELRRKFISLLVTLG